MNPVDQFTLVDMLNYSGAHVELISRELWRIDGELEFNPTNCAWTYGTASGHAEDWSVEEIAECFLGILGHKPTHAPVAKIPILEAA